MALIGRTVVGHDLLDLDAVSLEEAEGAGQEGGGAGLLLVGGRISV